ncbi:MAG TPA: MFS transporter, partial [Microbacterium sp.]|nr:MFS transporter [Microbacterium sp.]
MTDAEDAASVTPDEEATATTVPRDRWRILRPLAHRDFRALFIAVVLSIFAAGMWAVVMVYAVIAIGGGPVDLSLVAASNATGLLLCAIPGGIVADRVSRRLIVRAVSLVDFLAISSVVVVGAFGPVGIPQLVVVAFLLGAGAGFFFPAYSAILPRLLPPGQLLAANGLEGAIRPALQQAAGPAAAGMLLAALIPAHAAVAIAIAHGAAFVILMFLRPEPARQPWEHSDDGVEAGDHSAKSVFHDLREAVVFTVRTPWLLWTLLYATLWVLVVVGPEEVLLPFLIRERIGEDPRLFGFLLAVYGAGGVLGSIVVSSRKLPRRYLTTMNLVWGVSTLPFIIVGFTDQYWLLMASLFL